MAPELLPAIPSEQYRTHYGMAEEFHIGDRVVVRPLAEILATLDADGCLDGIPFMPEMARWCNRESTVARRANRVCVEGFPSHRGLDGAVFLEGLRCDGASHDGCQRACLTIWKEAWLRPASAPRIQDDTVVALQDLLKLPTRSGEGYLCQSTRLGTASRPFVRGFLPIYLADWRRGEITTPRLLHLLSLAIGNRLWRRLRGQRIRHISGSSKPTPVATLDLQAGEWVRVKTRQVIEATLDAQGRNRGLLFDTEMALHFGKRFRVAGRVTSMISEQTGQMLTLRDTVRLQGTDCQGIDAGNCPRANPFYWREIWLERCEPPI